MGSRISCRAVSLVGVVSLVAASFVSSCALRQFNTSKTKADDPYENVAYHEGLLKSRPWLEKFVKQIREEAHGKEDFTWDIDCPEVPEVRSLSFTADPKFRFDLDDGSPAHAPSLANAVIMSRASFLSYKKTSFLLETDSEGKTKPGAEARTWGFTKGELLSDPTTDVQAFVFSNASTVLVVFRGTSSLIDIIVDLDFVREKNTSFGGTHRGFSIAYNGRVRAKGIRAQMFDALTRHGYDVNLWKSIDAGKNSPGSAPSTTDSLGYKTNVDATLPTFPSKELWITGHSAGGALAQLMAADLSEREVEFRGLWGEERCESLTAPTNYVSGVVTFGSPRIGDAVFAKCMNAALKGRNWRFVSSTDIVAQIPWAEFGYRHAGDNLYLSDKGQLQLNPTLFEMAKDMSGSMFARFVRGEVSALAKGVEDHYVYPQPIQHQYDARCSHKRGVMPEKAP